MSTKVYELITSQIIEKLKEGVVPWQQPFVSGFPRNMVSKKAYRGINPLILSLSGRTTPYWMSYKQAKKLGGNVKKGEKGSIVVFWKFIEKKSEPGEFYPLLRYYKVFNLDQTEGIEAPESDKKVENDPITCAETLIHNMQNKPFLDMNGQSAYYMPVSDKVVVPPITSFVNSESFYSTLFHELTHSTMHSSRLNRDCGSHRFGSKDYSKEELVAELGACFLCGECDIKGTYDNSASYISGWLKKLESDVKFVVQASAQAQKACDYIKNVNWENEDE